MKTSKLHTAKELRNYLLNTDTELLLQLFFLKLKLSAKFTLSKKVN